MDRARIIRIVEEKVGDSSLMSSSLMKGVNLQQVLNFNAALTDNEVYVVALMTAQVKETHLTLRAIAQPAAAEDLYTMIELFSFLNSIPEAAAAVKATLRPPAIVQAGLQWSLNNMLSAHPACLNAANVGNVRTVPEAVTHLLTVVEVPNMAVLAIVFMNILSKGGQSSRANMQKVNNLIRGAFGDIMAVTQKDRQIIFDGLKRHLVGLTELQAQSDFGAMLDISTASHPRLRDQILRAAGFSATPLSIIYNAIMVSNAAFPWAALFANMNPACAQLLVEHGVFTQSFNDLMAEPFLYYRQTAGSSRRMVGLLYLSKRLLIEVYGHTTLADYRGGESGGQYQVQYDRFIADFVARLQVGAMALPAFNAAQALPAIPAGQHNPLTNLVVLDDLGAQAHHLVN